MITAALLKPALASLFLGFAIGFGCVWERLF
jgi:hypothetical protein